MSISSVLTSFSTLATTLYGCLCSSSPVYLPKGSALVSTFTISLA